MKSFSGWRAEKSFYFSLLFLYLHSHQALCWSTLISHSSAACFFLTISFLKISCSGLCNDSYNTFLFVYTHFHSPGMNCMKTKPTLLFNKRRKSYCNVFIL